MAVEIFGNVPLAVVSSGGTDAPASGATETWTVQALGNFPAVSSSATPPTQLHVADISQNTEIIAVTNMSGAGNLTWTVTRGAESTVPVTHAAGFVIYQVASAGAYAQLRSTDWLNAVTMFGADPTGATDSTSAINSALSAAPLGGTVYLNAGTYQTTAPLVIPPQVTLRGPGSWHLDTSTCEILPAAGFSGAAIILMYDQTTGGYSVASSSQAILNLIINGTNLSGSIDGIQSQGYVHGVIIQDVEIYKPPAHGIACATNSSGVAYSWRGTRVSANTCGTHGFSLAITDSSWYDLEAIGCGQTGFNLSGSPSNSHFTDCRAEFNGTRGFSLSGAWATGTGSGGVIFTACSTDRNGQSGVYLNATGSVPLTFNGLMCRRDGSTGASSGYAGVLATGHTLPTVINGLTVFPGVNDDGSGTNSPEYGVAFVSSSANIAVGDGAVIYAATTPWHDDGSNTNIGRGANIIERTGTTSSYTTAFDALQVSDSTATFESPSGLVTSLLAPGGSWLPSDSGWAAWNYDPASIGSSAVPASGVVQAIRVNVRVPSTAITNVILYQAAAGTALTSSENYVGLYNSSGTQIGVTADQSSAWTSGTAVFKTMALSGGPFTVTAGFYWVTPLANGTTNPAWGRFQNQSATVANAGMGAATSRWATGATGQASLPSSFTPSSYLTASSLEYWAGLS